MAWHQELVLLFRFLERTSHIDAFNISSFEMINGDFHHIYFWANGANQTGPRIATVAYWPPHNKCNSDFHHKAHEGHEEKPRVSMRFNFILRVLRGDAFVISTFQQLLKC